MVWTANLGESCLTGGALEEAIKHLSNSLHLAIKYNHKSLQSDIYKNLARMFLQSDRIDQGLRTCGQGIQLAEEMKAIRMLVYLNLNKATLIEKGNSLSKQAEGNLYLQLLQKTLNRAGHIKATCLIFECLRKLASL